MDTARMAMRGCLMAAVLMVVPLVAVGDSPSCTFRYVRSPTISSLEGDISVMPLRMVVDATGMRVLAGDVRSDLGFCEAENGVCVELGHGPLYIPDDWAPRRAVWVHGAYTYDQAPAMDDPRGNGRHVFPIAVLFKDADGRMEPLSMYLLDQDRNLVGFDGEVGVGTSLTRRTTLWRTSPYLLVGEHAPVDCFKRASGQESRHSTAPQSGASAGYHLPTP